jgi:hypothetical protein
MYEAPVESDRYKWLRLGCRGPFLSTDEDYIADMQDLRLSPAFHDQLWTLFWFPSARQKVPAEELVLYEAKFERCQRLMDKEEQIKVETEANKDKIMAEHGFRRPKNTGMSETDVEELRRTAVAKFLDATRSGKDSS